jgi:isocitrate dehydrogenase
MPPLTIALAPGDGIGPEITDATLAVLDAAGALDRLHFERVEMGKAEFERGNSRGISDSAIRTIEECGLVLKGPMETPKGGGGKSVNVTLRKLFSAYANLRVFRSLPGVETLHSRAGVPIELTIVRENIEDTYGGVEHRLTSDMIQCKRLISAPGSEQVARFAFETARRLGIRRVHCAHKANIMKMTDGLFLERFRAAARDYPEIEIGDVIVDALCMNLVLRPQQYRMIVLPNLQGDIVSDLCAGLVGGLGFAPSANIGSCVSIFEAVHGTAPDIAGQGIANPTSLILSAVMLLRHVGMLHEAALVDNALLATLEAGVRTGDFGDRSRPSVGTMAFAREIARRIGQNPATVPPVPVPPRAEPRCRRGTRPPEPRLIRTFTGVQAHVVGCDIYLDTTLAPAQLADRMNQACADTPFRLTLISNRGTQVWPTGSVYTECVDYCRVRFELREHVTPGSIAQDRCIALLDRVAQTFTVCSYELLRTFDGIKGYSMAQGQ